MPYEGGEHVTFFTEGHDMGAKRSTKARAKKMVTITIDARALRALSGALHKLSELASTFDAGCDDPTMRTALLKTRPRPKRPR